ncbi:MAG: tetratricopeptide repeat protein [Gemmatimonadetes bacterium]|nr:tetratricopeptide repeat protein [Gemmatimonadota bacterium]
MATPFLSSEDFDERAHQLYNAGEYDEALEVLREGLLIYPDAVDLHVGLGYVRLAREEFAWARHSFSQALGFDAEHEDAWVGLGEALLKFGDMDEALDCFARVDELGAEEDLELGLAIGRALYREGLYWESSERLTALAARHPNSAEALAALAYTLHALGDEPGACRALRGALRNDAEFHEARIYLSHLLFERGDLRGALSELECVPPREHWDPLSLWRTIELKCSLDGCDEQDPRLHSWRTRLTELNAEPDAIDHLLAEVEAAFESSPVEGAASLCVPGEGEGAWERGHVPLGRSEAVAEPEVQLHRVRTADGAVFTGTWEQIVVHMRDTLSDPSEPLSAFIHRTAQRIRTVTGRDLPCDDPETFLRESARLGLLRIEA